MGPGSKVVKVCKWSQFCFYNPESRITVCLGVALHSDLTPLCPQTLGSDKKTLLTGEKNRKTPQENQNVCVCLNFQQSISEDSSRLRPEIFLTGRIFRLFLSSVGGEWALPVEKLAFKETRDKGRNDDRSWKCQRFDRAGTVVSRARRTRSASVKWRISISNSEQMSGCVLRLCCL